MTPEPEAGLKANITLLLELVREQNARVDRLAEGVAWIKAHIANLPHPAKFYELRGRVEEISRRLPTPIAYVPPGSGRKDPAE